MSQLDYGSLMYQGGKLLDKYFIAGRRKYRRKTTKNCFLYTARTKVVICVLYKMQFWNRFVLTTFWNNVIKIQNPSVALETTMIFFPKKYKQNLKLSFHFDLKILIEKLLFQKLTFIKEKSCTKLFERWFKKSWAWQHWNEELLKILSSFLKTW